MTRRDQVLHRAAKELAAVSESARLDAELLLAHTLGCTRSALTLHGDVLLSPAQAAGFAALVAQRLERVPVAYLLGEKEFWSLSLQVTPAVLVPRPETEVLVELALQFLPAGSASRVLDLGTGSGAIALALATERPQAQVTGSDVSEAALAIAAANGARLGLRQIRWRAGSWFDAVPGERFDLIVSNPPYVAADDPHLQALTAEPRGALSSGPTGLEAYERLIPAARDHLTATGWIVLEHGASQAPQIQNLLEVNGFYNVRSHPDYSGALRVTLGSLHSNA
jgi:release factor glutamine methyltransferase